MVGFESPGEISGVRRRRGTESSEWRARWSAMFGKSLIIEVDRREWESYIEILPEKPHVA
jgi:hypothetical protein